MCIKRLALLFFSLSIMLPLMGQYRCQDLKSRLSVAAVPSKQNNAKSDTIDVLHYDLHLDFTALPSRFIKGHCDILFSPKMNGVSSMELDLLHFTVDSILLDQQALNYTYNDTLVRLYFPAPLDTTQTKTVQVYYHGNTHEDPLGWGGWHLQSGYYYNLGVGFGANPHTYGRSWFPCFDNFVEKTTYDFHLTTTAPLRPYCNGFNVSESLLGTDTLLSHWQMTDEIPTYLASVAISNYVVIYDTVSAKNGPMPIQLMAKKADSTKLINSFQNLKPTFNAFENTFGPYQWQKVGYAVTTKGAMEHATSIHYPVSLVNGNLSGEDIMAHELAHHWWGNLVTCQTDADMWINEGLAEYASHLYTEEVYGRARYNTTVIQNAFNVIESAHTQDDGYKSIYGLDHEYVYGFHVYQKGAMVGHNLRAYLGDSLFFSSLTQLLQNNAYGNLSTTQFRDQLSAISGKNMNAFFDDWVLNPGFPQVAIDSLAVNGNNAAVKVSQGIHHAPALYQNMPVFVTFFSETGDTTTRKAFISGSSTSAQFTNLPFAPAFALVGYSGHLLSADMYDEFTINRNGTYFERYSKLKISAAEWQDTAGLIAMHHYAGPQGKIPANADYKISKNHYWTIKGFDLDNANISARINYRGIANELDEDLVATTEDSIMVLYRKDATEAWQVWPHQTKNVQSINTNGIGYITIDEITNGDYVFANTSEVIALQEMPVNKSRIKIYPNPAHEKLIIEFSKVDEKQLPIYVTDSSGKLLAEQLWQKKNGNETIELSLSKISSPFIIVQVGDFAKKIILQ